LALDNEEDQFAKTLLSPGLHKTLAAALSMKNGSRSMQRGAGFLRQGIGRQGYA
jgi:hypothetical protein